MPVAVTHFQQGAVRADLEAIFISPKLSRSVGLVTCLSPSEAEKISKRRVCGGHVGGLLTCFAALQAKARQDRQPVSTDRRPNSGIVRLDSHACKPKVRSRHRLRRNSKSRTCRSSSSACHQTLLTPAVACALGLPRHWAEHTCRGGRNDMRDVLLLIYRPSFALVSTNLTAHSSNSG
jgi:hypothetical protein